MTALELLNSFLMSRGDIYADSEDFKHWCGLIPSCDSSRGLGQVQGGVLRDLDGLFHGSQQTLASLTPQGGAEALWTSDEQLHHHVGVFLHALTWC